MTEELEKFIEEIQEVKYQLIKSSPDNNWDPMVEDLRKAEDFFRERFVESKGSGCKVKAEAIINRYKAERHKEYMAKKYGQFRPFGNGLRRAPKSLGEKFYKGINKVRKGREGIEEGKFRIMMFHDKFKKVSRGGPLPPFENQSFAMAHSEYETIQDAKKVAKWLQNLNPHWTIQVWNWANTPVFTFEGAMVK